MKKYFITSILLIFIFTDLYSQLDASWDTRLNIPSSFKRISTGQGVNTYKAKNYNGYIVEINLAKGGKLDLMVGYQSSNGSNDGAFSKKNPKFDKDKIGTFWNRLKKYQKDKAFAVSNGAFFTGFQITPQNDALLSFPLKINGNLISGGNDQKDDIDSDLKMLEIFSTAARIGLFYIEDSKITEYDFSKFSDNCLVGKRMYPKKDWENSNVIKDKTAIAVIDTDDDNLQETVLLFVANELNWKAVIDVFFSFGVSNEGDMMRLDSGGSSKLVGLVGPSNSGLKQDFVIGPCWNTDCFRRIPQAIGILKGETPAKLYFPENNVTVPTTKNLELSWLYNRKTYGAPIEKHRIIIASDKSELERCMENDVRETSSNVIVNENVEASTNYLCQNLKGGTKYYWTVKTWANGIAVYSKVHVFSTIKETSSTNLTNTTKTIEANGNKKRGGITVTAGNTLKIYSLIKNEGKSIANNFNLKYYVSKYKNSLNYPIGEADKTYNLGSKKEIIIEKKELPIPISMSDGSFYVISKVDADNVVAETNEDDNIDYRKITITAVRDLIVEKERVSDDNVNVGDRIKVYCDVTNQGGKYASSSRVKYYLSTNSTFDSSDTYLTGAYVGGLGREESSSEDAYVTIPKNLPSGYYYILFKADANSSASEVDEDNNVEYVKIYVKDKNTSNVDLVIKGEETENYRLTVGERFKAYCNVKNQGTSNSKESSLDLYFSTDKVLDNSDTYLGSENVGDLVAGRSSYEHEYVRIPTSAEEGVNYILYIADADNDMSETDEDNNVAYEKIYVEAEEEVLPDLVITNEYLSTYNVEADNYVKAYCKVKNQGDAFSGTTRVHYRLSDDKYLSNDDQYIDDDRVETLAAGQKSSEEYDRVFIPEDTPTGYKYILFIADGENSVDESNELNNLDYERVYIKGITTKPDIVVINATTSSSIIKAGYSFHAYCDVKNQGDNTSNSSKLKYYLSTDEYFDVADRYLEDDYVGRLDVNEIDDEEQRLVIPSGLVSGYYYVLFVSDANEDIAESDETNNVEFVKIYVDGLQNKSDLVIKSPSITPTLINAGATVSVSYQVMNSSSVYSQVSYVKCYLSNNPTYSEDDIYLGQDYIPTLFNGQSINKNKILTIPQNTDADAWYIVIVADANKTVTESDETNNENHFAITVQGILNISPQNVTLAKEINSSFSATLISNVDWTITGIPSWLSVSPSSGNGNSTVILKALTVNNSTEAKNATLLVSGRGISKEINVAQQGESPSIIATPSSLSLGYEANSSQTFTVTSNIDWTISDIPDWLILSKVSGTNTQTITVSTINENATKQDNEATLTITGGGQTATINLVQTAKPYIEVANTTISSSYLGSSFSITISSNTVWSYSISQNWTLINNNTVGIGTGDAILTASVLENTTSSIRSCEIQFTIGSEIKIISFNQDASPAPTYAWVSQPNEITVDLNAVHAVDANNVYVVGDDGVAYKTTNGGSTWTALNTGTLENINDVYFTSSLIGYAVCRNGIILKTTNGGDNWSSQTSNTTDHLSSIFFDDSNSGWVTAEDGFILKTTNGGSTWQVISTSFRGSFDDIFFINSTTGWAVGAWFDNETYKTTDSGLNWSLVGTNSVGQTPNSVFFTSSSTGFVVCSQGRIQKTTNSGVSWSNVFNEQAFHSIYFTNSSNGWAAGVNGIFKTIDTGNNWEVDLEDVGILYDIHFSSDGIGWSVGKDSNGNGVIYKYSQQKKKKSSETLINDLSFDNQVKIFPNPTNEYVNIVFTEQHSNLRIEIFSTVGNLVKTVTRHNFKGTSHQVLLSELNSGMYLLKIKTRTGSTTKRLTIVR